MLIRNEIISSHSYDAMPVSPIKIREGRKKIESRICESSLALGLSSDVMNNPYPIIDTKKTSKNIFILLNCEKDGHGCYFNADIVQNFDEASVKLLLQSLEGL